MRRRFPQHKKPDCPAIILFRYSDRQTIRIFEASGEDDYVAYFCKEPLDQRDDQGGNSEQFHGLVLFEIDKTYSRVQKEICLRRKLGVVLTQRPDIAIERL